MAIKYTSDNAPERKKSTASRKDASGLPAHMEFPPDGHGGSEALENKITPEGTQAPPVDTPSRTFRTRAPNNTFDRKAYMTEYMKLYRRKHPQKFAYKPKPESAKKPKNKKNVDRDTPVSERGAEYWEARLSGYSVTEE